MSELNHLFFYGNEYHPHQVFLNVPAGDIFQIAELSIIKGSEIPEHTQICDEITYVFSGKAKVYSDDECFEMTAGQIHFIKKDTYHKIVADADSNFHYYCFGFMVNQDNPEMKKYQREVRKLKHFLVNDDGRMNPLDLILISRYISDGCVTHLQLLMNEYYNYTDESAQMIHHYFCQIVMELGRIARGEWDNNPGRVNSASVNKVVYRVLKYIDREHWNISSVKQIAEALSYSEYYLSHIFKDKMEITIKEYLMQRKILAATELLKNTSMGIEEISEHLNFSSAHTFRQAFKRYMNMNASEYRNKMR